MRGGHPALTHTRTPLQNAWLYEDKNKPLMLRSAHEEPKLAIEEGPSRGQVETDGFGTGNAPDGALLSWKHISKNQLYYYKDGAAFSTRLARLGGQGNGGYCYGEG